MSSVNENSSGIVAIAIRKKQSTMTKRLVKNKYSTAMATENPIGFFASNGTL